MAQVAAYDDICSTGGRQRQILVVLAITAFLNLLGRFDPVCGNHHKIKDTLAAFGGDKAIKLGAEDNIAIFVLDRLRKNQPVGCAYRTQQSLFWAAI